MKKLLIGSAIVVSIAMTTIGVVQANGKGCQFNGFSALELTDKQQTEIKAIWEKAWEKRSENNPREMMKNLQQEVAKLVNAETLDKEALDQLATKQAEKIKAGFIQQVEIQHQISQVLTKEQREKFAEMRNNFFGKGKFGVRGGGRFGPWGQGENMPFFW